MRRFLRGASAKSGQIPGTPIYVGEEKLHVVSAERIVFDRQTVEQQQGLSLDRLKADTKRTTWVRINGVHDVDGVQSLAETFSLHPLVVEDIVHTGHRPKVEVYDGRLFLVLRMLRWREDSMTIEDEQISLILGPTWLISFEEKPSDLLEPIRDRIIADRGRVRAMGADYLAYVLMDAVVDRYFSVLESVGDRIDLVSEELTKRKDGSGVREIRHIKRELLFLRKSVWPLRELVGSLQRERSDLISSTTAPYLRDLYDHTIQIIDTVETYRDMVSGLMDLYMSTLSHRMNETMKVLTLIATIFIPLSFVAGVYGMNFLNMPELQWRYGYVMVLGLMAAMAAGMLAYFRRRRWL